MIKPELLVNELRSAALADPDFARLDKLFQRGIKRPININGPTDSQKTVIMLSLLAADNTNAALITSDELRTRSAASELRSFLDKPVFVFRPRELNLTDAEAASRDAEMKRLAVLGAVLQGNAGALVMPAAAVMQKIMLPEQFRHNCIELSAGKVLEIADLCLELDRIGYERVKMAETAGQYARRGDIVDVVMAGADENSDYFAVRISFFDLEIDSIRELDLSSQRSMLSLEKIQIIPAREIILDAETRTDLASRIFRASDSLYRQAIENGAPRERAEYIRNQCRYDSERIENSVTFAGIDRWLSWIFDKHATVLDYVKQAGLRLFLDEPLRIRNRLDSAQADLEERTRHMLLKGHTIPVEGDIQLRSSDVGAIFSKWSGLTAFCQIVSSGNGLPGADSADISGRSADSYRGREQILLEDLNNDRRENYLSIIFTGSDSRQKRITELLSDAETPISLISNKLIAQGFVWPAAKIRIIGSQDLFGSERSARKRKNSGIRIDLFSDLKTGEMVVHEAHGIGRYEGLVNMDNHGIRRDYLQIRYAGDDLLYIPVESLDQIQKFVGSEGRDPKPSKLGGQDWHKLKEKARQSIRKLATDLIKLYSERQAHKGYSFSPDTVWQQEFEEDFAFEETDDQLRCIAEIKADMESARVMDRLLCGDVGFGKTEVAFRAMFKCVMDGKQAIMLSPTTVLAQQHYENLKTRMADFPVRIGLLSRFASESMQKETLRGLKNGQIDIVVGTHRLLSKDVSYKNPGLLVVDEEQRFGVDHKEKIKVISPDIDVLTLTATPIPRTLHMSMSGIRDISVIEQAPLERRPVQTYVMEYDEDIAAEAILRELSRQGQVFYLYNDTRRILEKTAALEKLLPGALISYAHGKMGEKKLEDIISSFINGESDVLVCTTIIESGIDMPNVNTIIVEDADRLGLSQLYQLRGRVGRSDRQAFAYITYRRDKILSEVAEKRLAAIRDFTELGSGFKIALRDLEVRGAGNLLGAEQHGHLDAIGYDLYCRMLEETIKEMQGGQSEIKTPAVIELDVDAYLSSQYIPDEAQRMDMYRRIAAIDSQKSYQDVLDEMIDRYGDPAAPAITLADIAYIRSTAEKHGFARIYENRPNLVFAYADNVQPDMGFLSAMLSSKDNKGLLLFNAGARPHVIFRQAAADRNQITARLRHLFIQAEAATDGLMTEAAGNPAS
jgi:transcription-repair coupling factor (superfamily II helicase)